MTRLAQLSDLHFGSEDPATVDALVEHLNSLALDLVILSGDLTMAARRDEFERARRFIERLDAPALSVPGNHDVTPYHLIERFTRPWARWRRYVSAELEPDWSGEGVAVVGINTARRLRLGLDWSHGSVSRGQMKALAKRFGRASEPFRIVVAHHPFLEEVGADLSGRPRIMVRRAEAALGAFAQLRVDLVVGGHLHRTYASTFDAATPGGSSHRVTVIQAGTALSSRTRNEPNAFNLIEVDRGQLSVTAVMWGDGAWERQSDPLAVLSKPLGDQG